MFPLLCLIGEAARLRRVGVAAPTLTLLVLAAACARTLEDQGDAPAALEAPLFETRLVWSAGGTEEAGGLQLQWVHSGALGPGGRVAVVDRRGRQVLLLAADGSLEATLGRTGDGPGEFREPHRVGFEGDSTVWLSDMTGRLLLFRSDGSAPATLRAPRGTLPERPEWFTQGVNWLLRSRSALVQVASFHPRQESPLVLASPAGDVRVLEWLGQVPPETEVRIGPGEIFMRQPLQADPIVGASPDGAWFFVLFREPGSGNRGEILVRRFDPSGREVGRTAIPYVPKPLDSAGRAWITQYVRNWTAGVNERSTVGRVDVDEALAAAWVPDFLPPVWAAVAYPEGLWLRRERFGGWEAPADALWERYDLEGRLLRRAILPAGRTVLAADTASFLAWTLDSLMTPVLELHRVEAPSGGEGP